MPSLMGPWLAWNPPRARVQGWIVFNGSGTVDIRASENVSSITDNGVGDYTINWSRGVASIGADGYAPFVIGGNAGTGSGNISRLQGTQTDLSVRVVTGGGVDQDPVCVLAISNGL